MKKPLGVTDNAGRSANYFPAFLDLVRRQLREDYQEDALTETGLTVFTTLDPLLQQKAEDALSEELERQDKSGRKAVAGSRRRDGRHDAADRRSRGDRRRPAGVVRRLQSRARHASARSVRSRSRSSISPR